MNEESLLKTHDVNPTALRLLILRTIVDFRRPFTFEDIYHVLGTVDRSTVFRAITLFEQHHLLYGFEDGMGKRKYCLVHEHVDGTEADGSHQQGHHVHISCRICGRSFCLASEHTPAVRIPEDFEVENINYIVTGVCANCRKHWG